MQVRGPSRSLLSRRDWVYLLSLLVPFVAYDLVLKGLLVASRAEDPGLIGGLGLMQSDLMFNLGYALLWVGLFAVARRRFSRWIFTGLFHAMTILVALITTSAYRYFEVTGSTLDSKYILIWLSAPEGTGGVIASEFTPGLLMLVLSIFVYAILGPPLVTRLVFRWRRGRSDVASAQPARIAWLHLVGVGLVTYALFSLSLLPGGGSLGESKSFSRDAVVNVMTTAAEVADGEDLPDLAVEPVDPHPEASLLPTAESEKRNVVLIFLESTRDRATTPYNEDLKTTPFLNELAKSSLLAEDAYAVVPHTHNALTATNCGVEPPLDRRGTLLLGDYSGGVSSTCLADLLKKRGYNAAYFMAQSAAFENSPKILQNLGYEDFHSVETMDTDSFEQSSYFGYEEDIMLEPSRRWLEENGDEPFLATYLTSSPHHDYRAPQRRYGRVEYTEDDLVNRYLNGVRLEDFFLKNLFDQYKELGLYDNTVFIILGDHGEGFGEHGRFQHDNTIYEEGLKIPMLIHDPRWCADGCESGWRVQTPVNQLDVLPTVADLLGYQIEGGDYGGSSLLRPLPEDRTLMYSCWSENGCMASLKGTEKYIYHFDDQPEEIFDIAKDPAELQNLAGQRPEEARERRQELLEWRAKVNSRYGE